MLAKAHKRLPSGTSKGNGGLDGARSRAGGQRVADVQRRLLEQHCVVRDPAGRHQPAHRVHFNPKVAVLEAVARQAHGGLIGRGRILHVQRGDRRVLNGVAVGRQAHANGVSAERVDLNGVCARFDSQGHARRCSRRPGEQQRCARSEPHLEKLQLVCDLCAISSFVLQCMRGVEFFCSGGGYLQT